MGKAFPIENVRSKFPALNRVKNNKTIIYFDGPGGTQMVKNASEEMISYISNGMANLHGTFITSEETESIIQKARNSISSLLECRPNEVAFGPNMTSLAFSIARALSASIKEGDEIVVTELDHRANVDPWITMARDKGAVIKFIKLDPITYSLQLEELDQVITKKTKLVAVGMSSNVTGTITDVRTIANKVKEVNAVMILDAVHAVPHMAIDFGQLNCDILFCSSYKFFGPHLGIAVIQEDLFEKLPVYKLDPAPAEIPHKLETGTQSHESIAGLNGTIQFIEQLGEGKTRREKLVSGIRKIDEYETSLADDLESFLRNLPEVHLYRGHEDTKRTPTFSFTMENRNSRFITSWFAEQYNMCIADGDFYASTMAKKFGVYSTGGWVRIGLAPYNTYEEIELFKEGMNEFIKLK